jgi:hypothetical protein
MMKRWICFGLLVALSAGAHARITPVSDDFSTDTGTFPDWGLIDSVMDTEIIHDTVSENDYDKLDLIDSTGNPLDGDGVVGNLAGDTEAVGDGVQGDGGLRLDTGDGIQGNESMGLTVAGTLQEGETAALTGTVYNDNTSFVRFKVQLWNLTDDRLLAETALISVNGSTHLAYLPQDLSVSYTAVAADAGDVLQIRFVEDANNLARDIYLDNFSVTTDVPERAIRLFGVTN